MGWQTCEALKERKLNNWVKKGIINGQQELNILGYCEKYGFWDGLGYATRIKYKNNPDLKKKYQYKFIIVPKKECLLVENKTSGALSDKGRKRIRKWRNIYFNSDGTEKIDWNKWDKYPEWKVFLVDRQRFLVGLRKSV